MKETRKLHRLGGPCHYGTTHVPTGGEVEVPIGVARELVALPEEWKLAEGELEIPPAPVEPPPETVQTSAQDDHSSPPRRRAGHK